MKNLHLIAGLGLAIFTNSLLASNAQDNYKVIASLQGDWKMAAADKQEGGATKKGPASKLIGTDKTAMRFKVIGKGSTVQENLLPGTGKEMATMYHCNNFKNCTEVQAKHYCAKQNQPEFILNAASSNQYKISMVCTKDSAVCNSVEGHVHKLTHELSNDGTGLKTTYTIFKNRKYQKDSIYHFIKK